MRICSLAIKVLHIFVACLIVGSGLGWFPASVNASSLTNAPDFSIYSSLTQNTAIESPPITSNPLYSPANGTWEVTDIIHLSGTERPLQIAVAGGKAYVSRNPGHLTVLDLSTNAVVTTISFDPYPGAAPHYIGILGDKAYVALSNLGSDGQLAVINIGNNTVAGYIPVGADPYGVATLGQKVYVTNNVWWSSGDPATVKVVNVSTNSVVATIPVGINPTGIAVDPVSKKAYVTNRNDLSKSVSVINTNADSVIATIPINNPPAGVAISGNRAYVTTVVNMPNGTVEVIDIGSDTLISSIPVGRDSWGIAASNDYVFVANQSSSTVSVIEVATNSVVATVNVGDDPTHIAVDPSTSKVYVSNQGDNTISVIQFKETAPPSNQPPAVSITSPPNGATVSGAVSVQGTASDPDGNSQLQRVEVKVDTGGWTQASGTTSWSYSWDTTTIPNGQHSIYARSYDGQAYSSEELIVVSVNNVTSTPSLVDVGISSEAEAWPPKAFLQAKPGDRINTWYRISYAGSLTRVKLKTTIFDPNGREIGNPLNDPFIQIDGPTEDTGWVGVTFEIPAEAITGTYDVRFSVWSENGAQEYDALVKSGWLSLDSAIHTGTIEVTSDPSGASFTLSGPANYSDITPWSKTDAPAGIYTITWTPISGYQTPSQESKTLTQGGAISFHGPYQLGKGTIEVASDPSGASFTLSGPANYSDITPWSKTDAPAGIYTITWTPISGYQTPSQESKTLTQGGAISFYGHYQSGKGTIEVTSNPPGTSFTLSGPANYSDITPWSKTDAPVGTYTITWGFMTGYQPPAQERKNLTQGGMLSFYGSYTVMEAFPGANAVTLSEYYSAWRKSLPPLSERAKMYEALDLGSATNYTGTAEQNTRLLDALKHRQICPSTGEEVGWVSPPTTLAQLIQQEATGGVPVTVDGKLYIILTLRNRIDPATLKVVPNSGATKVYVYGDRNYPVSSWELAQKIGVIDSSRRWIEGVGSANDISQNIELMRERWAIHRKIKWLGFSLELLPATAAISVRACFTSGYTIPLDVLNTAAQMFLAHASNPGWVLENVAFGNFTEAEEEYRKAMELAGGTGAPRDYETASAYFKHLFNAYANDYSAWQLLNQIDRIDKKTLEELADLGGRFSASLVGMNYGLFETLVDSLRALPLTSSYFGIWDQWLSNYENIVSELNYHARYTLALARKDPALIEGAGSEELWTVAKVGSPVELRVYDSQGRVAGMVNGETRSEIPNSSYHDDAVTILFPSDSYSYEVAGISEGSYDLSVTTVVERTSTFTLSDVPTSASVVHQYTIDWDALAEGEKGVAMKIDADGDGTFEDIKYLGQEGIGFSWVWGVVVGLSALLGVLVGAFMVWRRMGKKQAT